MAPRSISIITSALLCGFVLAPLFAVGRQAETFAGLGPADWSALRFTILQALFSAFISCSLAIPVARALSRSKFLGRGLVIKLMGAPFILPVLVAILGLIAVFGQNGWANIALRSVGLANFSIYGLQGILLAHDFFQFTRSYTFDFIGLGNGSTGAFKACATSCSITICKVSFN